jgi:hypothetical protein
MTTFLPGARRKRASRHGEDANREARIAELKEKINNDDYVYGAIFRIAQVVSNEIVGLPQGGANDGKQWESRRA